MLLKVKKLTEVASPRRANTEAAGIDFHSPRRFVIYAGDYFRLSLGVALEVPPGWCLCLCNRSGLASKGVYVTWGVIDSDYRGEVVVELRNFGEREYWFEAGDRVCQGLLLPAPDVGIVVVDELSVTERGDKGFGSTGR